MKHHIMRVKAQALNNFSLFNIAKCTRRTCDWQNALHFILSEHEANVKSNLREQTNGFLLTCFFYILPRTRSRFYECELSIVCLSLTLCLNILLRRCLVDLITILKESFIQWSRIYFLCRRTLCNIHKGKQSSICFVLQQHLF